MSAAVVFGFLFLFFGNTTTVQTEEGRQIKSCPLLTDSEAIGLIGTGTIFVTGVEGTSGKVRISLLCEWVKDERTLKVQATKTLGDKATWETIRKMSNGTIEPGLGDYAYSAFDNGRAAVVIVKGPLTLELVIAGKGASSADLPKLKEAAKKAVSKL